MLRESQKLIDKINITVSGVIMLAIFGICHWAINIISPRLAPFNTYLGPIGVFIFVVLVLMFARGISVSKRFIHPFGVARELFICVMFGLLGFGFFTYIFKASHLSRLYLLSGIILGYLATLSFFLLVSALYKGLRSHGFNFQNALLVGNKYTLPQFIDTIEKNKALGLKIVGVMSLEQYDEQEFMGQRHVGSVNAIERVLNSEAVDFVIFTVYRQDPAVIEKAILVCQERGIDVWLKPDFMQKVALPHVDYLEDIPLFIFALGPKNEFALMVKRLIDVAISSIALLVGVMPMLLIAFLIRTTTKGPAFFLQRRVGLHGRRFMVYKFRTMYTDIKQRKFERSLKNEMKGPAFKMRNDPRITLLGRFLRRYSLDELPQFWNVLIGNMSLVGARPPLPTEVSLYKGWHRRRLSMRPGLTCIWQVSGRNQICDFDEWAKLDLKYIDTWSLLLDFTVLFKTIPTVLKGSGC